MASLSKYVLDHDEKTIFVKEEKNGITIFDARKIEIDDCEFSTDLFFDYKLSFRRISFDNSDEKMKAKLFEIMDNLAHINVESWYNKKIQLNSYRNIDKEKNEIKISQNGDKWILEKKYFRNQRLDNCFISLHLNEKEHPHLHIIGPKKLSLGKNFKGLEKNIHKIAIDHNVVTPEMEYAFDKNYDTGLLSNAEIRGKYNSFLTAKQVLSKLSWTFEQARRESDYNLFLDSKEKIIENQSVVYAGRYAVSVKNNTHTKIGNRHIYSLNQLIKDYKNFKYAGSNSFIYKLLIENKEIFKERYGMKINIPKSKTEEQFEKKEYSSLIKSLAVKIEKSEQIEKEYLQFWSEYKDSSDKKLKKTAQAIKELYAEKRTIYREPSKDKIKEIVEKYALSKEEIIEEFKKLIEVEEESESNIIEQLKNNTEIEELSLTLSDDKKQVLIVKNENEDYIELAPYLKGKDTVFQCICENRNKSTINKLKENIISKTTEKLKGNKNKENIIKALSIINDKTIDNIKDALVPLHLYEDIEELEKDEFGNYCTFYSLRENKTDENHLKSLENSIQVINKIENKVISLLVKNLETDSIETVILDLIFIYEDWLYSMEEMTQLIEKIQNELNIKVEYDYTKWDDELELEDLIYGRDESPSKLNDKNSFEEEIDTINSVIKSEDELLGDSIFQENSEVEESEDEEIDEENFYTTYEKTEK